ncbi:hypothetical protein A1C_03585 [Rickettsia akari str. Hartford]|uniref:Uncharacterized protein n=1 Tax=Rickettsia akari (strain Hartford) TaxID=293614 RepID=A8GNM3_RICAH|nr:hypothetical protein A1C_03585 [Rickettsia akari str. Hartford]
MSFPRKREFGKATLIDKITIQEHASCVCRKVLLLGPQNAFGVISQTSRGSDRGKTAPRNNASQE